MLSSNISEYIYVLETCDNFVHRVDCTKSGCAHYRITPLVRSCVQILFGEPTNPNEENIDALCNLLVCMC